MLPFNWGELLQTNRVWLRTVIAARGARNADEVDDIFQNVALAAVRQQAPIRDPAKAVPWLYRLAVIQTALYRRAKGRYRKRVSCQETIPETENFVSKEREPIDWLLREERKKMVTAAMEQLAPPVREILLLKYVHDWSYSEMAEKLGTTVSAVQSKLHRARIALKKEILAGAGSKKRI